MKKNVVQIWPRFVDLDYEHVMILDKVFSANKWHNINYFKSCTNRQDWCYYDNCIIYNMYLCLLTRWQLVNHLTKPIIFCHHKLKSLCLFYNHCYLNFRAQFEFFYLSISFYVFMKEVYKEKQMWARGGKYLSNSSLLNLLHTKALFWNRVFWISNLQRVLSIIYNIIIIY